jgi:hypothetical protein
VAPSFDEQQDLNTTFKWPMISAGTTSLINLLGNMDEGVKKEIIEII